MQHSGSCQTTMVLQPEAKARPFKYDWRHWTIPCLVLGSLGWSKLIDTLPAGPFHQYLSRIFEKVVRVRRPAGRLEVTYLSFDHPSTKERDIIRSESALLQLRMTH